ncbi:hypothetical protein GGR52DRAFT_347454 [Hypoxylon sp. FL1284]|nr:hypothetical protein GGR52DRAFT_347454 [Hypoxylon sp. FL1284]
MSSQWRQVSNGNWEVTRSNPPSELLNDPITATSSNPDERTSSPSMTERTNDFSNAAQMETEPIPSDGPIDESDDMLYRSSPPRQSLKKTGIAETTSEAVSNGDETNYISSDLSDLSDMEDPDFKPPESDYGEQDTDTTYGEGTAQRRSKKRTANKGAPSKKAPRKAAEKSIATAKSSLPATSVAPGGSGHFAAAKGNPRKTNVTSRAVPKAGNEAISAVNVKGKSLANAGKIIPDSQPLDAEKQTKSSQSASRLAKQSFFSQREDGPSTQAAEEPNDDAKSQLHTEAKTDKKQSSISPNSKKKREHQDVLHRKSARLLKSNHAKDHNPISSGHGANRIPKRASNEEVQDKIAKELHTDVPNTVEEYEPETAATPEQDIQQIEETPLPESIYSERSEPNVQNVAEERLVASAPVVGVSEDVEKRARKRPQLVEKGRGLGKPNQSSQRVSIPKATARAAGATTQGHSNNRREHFAKKLLNQDEVVGNAGNKTENSIANKLYSPPSAQAPSSSGPPAPTTNTGMSKDGSDTDVGLVLVQEQIPAHEVRGHHRHDTSPAQLTRPLMDNDLRSPLDAFGVSTRNVAPPHHEEQQRNPDKNQGYSVRNPLRNSSDRETGLLQTAMPSSTNSELPHARSPKKPGVTKSKEKHLSILNRISRMMTIPSMDGGLAGEPAESVPEAVHVQQKSVEFAQRVMQEQAALQRDEIERQVPVETEEHQGGSQPSWSQLAGSMKHRNDPKPASSRDAKVIDSSGGYSFKGNGPSSHAKPGLAYEAKWKDAVNEASSGVADVLHMISTNLLEHLRTREQNVFAIVHEYKRNGTKISQNLVTHQQGELVDASKKVKQKCSELEAFYGKLSVRTQDFRAKCMSKQRNQAYAEWQRQTAKVKGAIRAAREAAIMG